MKRCSKYLSILLITGLVFAAGSSAIAQQYYRVTVDGLNIRSGPGKNYNTITVALKGDTLEAIHDLKGWMEVVAIKNNTRGVRGYTNDREDRCKRQTLKRWFLELYR